MKKATIYHLIIVLAASISLTACYTNFDLDHMRGKPKVVLNSAISPDTTIMASVSHSVFFPDGNEQRDLSIKDAKVDLFVNGKFCQQMVWTTDTIAPNYGIYRSTVRPKQGDVVKITADTKLGQVSAEDEVPEKIKLESVKFTTRKVKDPNNSIVLHPDGSWSYMYYTEITYYITFKDDPTIQNYYCIKIEDPDISYHNYILVGLNYASDPVFQAQQPDIDGATQEIKGGARAFSDDLFNGKTYTMKIIGHLDQNDYEEDSGAKKVYEIISLYSLSKPYYLYLTQYLNRDQNITKDLTDFGLVEPTLYYSNIDGGTGILGSIQGSNQVIDLSVLTHEK